MLRFKYFIFYTRPTKLLLCSWVLYFSLVNVGHSQVDSSYYIRYASAYDELLPENPFPLPELSMFVKDTAGFLSDHSNRVLKIRVFQVENDGKKSDTLPITSLFYRFDKEARVIGINYNYTDDSTKSKPISISYLRGKIPLNVFSEEKNGRGSDSIKYKYDRSGKLTEMCREISSRKKDTTICIRLLYDNSGRLIVSENDSYWIRRGTFMYYYDKNSRLVTRKFIEPKSGIVICTDSISYEMLDQSTSTVLVKHLVRVSGTTSWTLIDQAVVNEITKMIMAYKIVSSQFTHPHHHISAGWGANFIYDSIGRLSRIDASDSSGHLLKKTLYSYGAKSELDSMSSYTYEVMDGRQEMTDHLIQVTYYDEFGKIKTKSTSLYALMTSKKNKVWVLKMDKQELYTWNKN